MKKNNLLLNTALLFFISAIFYSFNIISDQEPWDVPTKYEKMTNSTDPGDAEGMAVGKQLYMKHCKSCHGKTGLGDGSKAEELDTSCGDFSTEAFQAQSDGSLYYKTVTGRDDMPAFDKKLPAEEDRWLVVNYMRALAK